MQNKSKRLLLVDLDGTLLHGNSLPHYLLVAVGWWKLLLGFPMFLIRCIVLLLKGNFQFEKIKIALFRNYMLGQSRTILEQSGEQCTQQKLIPMLNPVVHAAVIQGLANGDTVVLVTASLDIWVKSIARHLGFQFLCTQAEYDAEGMFTGRFATPNCKYEEKRRRILEKFDLSKYSKVVAYGNSDGDAAMFELAGEVWWVKREGSVVCLKKAA
ncbi:MAG: HAD-IB family phosphatase [Saprospiraceae bacterium]|nr:HAD-IB family phosphatase [Saprospiraceae bacterium]